MKDIDTLVIGGGSIKTIASLGALSVLHEKGILENINKYAGSSAGAVIITLLVLGYTHNEINELIFSKIGSYVTEPFYKIPINMIYNYGIYTGNNMVTFLEGFFEKKGFKKNITFKELYEIIPKVLVITGTSLTSCDTLFFNYQTTPNMSVIKALRISISIPLYFTSVKYLHKGKYHQMCDGALLYNFPLYYFNHIKKDNQQEDITNINKSVIKLSKVNENIKLAKVSENENEYILYDSFNELYKNKIQTSKRFKDPIKSKFVKDPIQNNDHNTKSRNIIGIMLLEEDENRDTENFYTGFKIITNLKEYIISFIETMWKKIEHDNFINPLTGTKNNFFNDTITIKTPSNINAIKFNLTVSENKMLYDLGIKAANEFFESDLNQIKLSKLK